MTIQSEPAPALTCASAPSTNAATHPIRESDNVPAVSTFTTYKLPPRTAVIPSPPAGFVPTHGSDYRGVLPRRAELAVIEDAVTELKGCADFADIFGRTIPSIAILIAMFDGGAQWSSTRAQTSAYDDYSRTQEGLIWIDLRKIMAKVRPVFEQAVATDPSISARLSAFGRLLGAKKAISQRAVATRKANQEAIARGEPVARGRAAKAKARRAEKAALAAQRAAEAAPT